MLHAVNVVLRGYKRILIIANGTYIIVLGTSIFNDTGADKLWVSFGIGNKCLSHLISLITSSYDIAITESFVILFDALCLGPQCKALPVFHAVTGCDTASSFA